MKTQALYTIYTQHPTIITDSRKAAPNSIFFALQGENFDGNAYAESALEAGCNYAVIDKASYQKDARYLLVDNSLKALQALARHHRRELDIPVIAITGSNGKTTTKELVSTVLARKYKTGYTQGNYNNHIGVPLSLLALAPDTEMAVIEMGANHVGEIAALCEIAEPNFGLITNVGHAHLEGFGSFEGVKQGKGELYEWLAENGGLVFINSDNDHLLSMLGVQASFSYGQSALAECSGELLPATGFYLQAKAILHIDDEQNIELVQFNTQLLGQYNFENVLAAAAIGKYFGLLAQEIKAAIEAFQPNNNRSQLIQTQQNTILLDAYNANPTSMRAALTNMAELAVDNKLLILGDMFEMGEFAQQMHQEIVDLLMDKALKNVYLVGKAFAKTASDFAHFESTEQLALTLQQKQLAGYHILIKGSRSMQLEKLVQHL